MVAFSFLAYVPTSKHFHILGAPFNAVLQQLEGHQKMDFMDLEAELDFEAKGESYGCELASRSSPGRTAWTCSPASSAGRCQEVCPAHATGKLLSPSATSSST